MKNSEIKRTRCLKERVNHGDIAREQDKSLTEQKIT